MRTFAFCGASISSWEPAIVQILRLCLWTWAEMTSFLKKGGSKVGSRNLDKPSTPEEEQAKVNLTHAYVLQREYQSQHNVYDCRTGKWWDRRLVVEGLIVEGGDCWLFTFRLHLSLYGDVEPGRLLWSRFYKCLYIYQAVKIKCCFILSGFWAPSCYWTVDWSFRAVCWWCLS